MYEVFEGAKCSKSLGIMNRKGEAVDVNALTCSRVRHPSREVIKVYGSNVRNF